MCLLSSKMSTLLFSYVLILYTIYVLLLLIAFQYNRISELKTYELKTSEALDTLPATFYVLHIRHVLPSCMSPTHITVHASSQYCYSCLHASGSLVGSLDSLPHVQWMITSLICYHCEKRGI